MTTIFALMSMIMMIKTNHSLIHKSNWSTIFNYDKHYKHHYVIVWSSLQLSFEGCEGWDLFSLFNEQKRNQNYHNDHYDQIFIKLIMIIIMLSMIIITIAIGGLWGMGICGNRGDQWRRQRCIASTHHFKPDFVRFAWRYSGYYKYLDFLYPNTSNQFLLKIRIHPPYAWRDST